MGLAAYNGHSGQKREQVQRWLNQQWATGALPRPTECVACGQTEGTIDGHLEDYDQPASYISLCVTCHMLVHMRFRHQNTWRDYVQRVADGWQAPPTTRPAVIATLSRGILAGHWPAGITRPVAPGQTFLNDLTLDRARTPALFDL